MDVVDMYEWLFPEDIDPDQMTEHYRHEELNLIMQERKNQKRELQKFERKLEHKNIKVPVTEVTDAQPKTDKILHELKGFEVDEVEERTKENLIEVEDCPKNEEPTGMFPGGFGY
jgi:hypothetical protein